jgi:hypothetical protein
MLSTCFDSHSAPSTEAHRYYCWGGDVIGLAVVDASAISLTYLR